jgi:hypothetical protein
LSAYRISASPSRRFSAERLGEDFGHGARLRKLFRESLAVAAGQRHAMVIGPRRRPSPVSFLQVGAVLVHTHDFRQFQARFQTRSGSADCRKPCRVP